MNKYFKFLLIALIVAFVVPQMVLAAWWNPFSWGIWNRIFHFQQTEQKSEQLIGGDKDAHGCLAAAGYSWCEAKSKCLRTWEEKCEISTDKYSFIAIESRDGMKQYPDESIEIYKNQKLIKIIVIKDSFEKPSLFAVSPDQKYVAFRTATYGGTCVYSASPMVIDLNNFSIINLDNSDINKKLNSALGIDVNGVGVKFGATQEIKNIKWLSNNTLEASMQFGNETCHITWADKPVNTPIETSANVTFSIVE